MARILNRCVLRDVTICSQSHDVELHQDTLDRAAAGIIQVGRDWQ